MSKINGSNSNSNSNSNSKGRGRGRGSGGKRPHGRGNGFGSSGGRNSGNAQQLLDKYLSLARDAASQGDRIATENFYQHADHYHRVVFARNEQQEARRKTSNSSGSTAQINGEGISSSEGQADEAEIPKVAESISKSPEVKPVKIKVIDSGSGKKESQSSGLVSSLSQNITDGDTESVKAAANKTENNEDKDT
jgi:hypothetical protein